MPWSHNLVLKMKKSNITKEKGDIGLGYVISDLMNFGIHISLPISEHLPFDCISISNEGNMNRISVKYRKINRHGVIEMRYDANNIDILAIYCPDTKKCYYIGKNLLKNNKSIALRMIEPKHRQKNIIYATDVENRSILI